MIWRSGISRANFRAGLIELGKFISYEFANTLEKEYLTVKTPLG
jgi:uracil phosphoribosyltransferase